MDEIRGLGTGPPDMMMMMMMPEIGGQQANNQLDALASFGQVRQICFNLLVRAQL